MGIYRTPDRLTSCNPELYDNIYQINKRADYKPASVGLDGVKDTIERSPSKEALNRLQQPSKYMIFQQGALFRRIGKYLFLSVALPPYFLLWGLPKWLLVEGLPVLTSAMGWVTTQLQQQLKKPYDAIVQKVNQLLFFIQIFGSRIIKPAASLGIEIGRFFQRMSERVIQITSRIVGGIKKGLKKPSSFLADRARGVLSKWIQARAWVSERMHGMQERLQEGLQWIKEVPQNVLSWGGEQIRKAANYQTNWTIKLSSKFQVSKRAAQICSGWAGKQMGALKELVQKGITPIAEFYRNAFKPRLARICGAIKARWSALSEFLNDRKRRTLEFLEQSQERMKTWTAQNALDQLLSASFLKKLPALLRKVLIFLKQNAICRALFNFGFHTVKFVLTHSNQLVQLAIHGFSKIFQQLSRGAQVFSNGVKRAAQTIFGLASVVFGTVKTVWDRVLHGILVLLFMAGILLLWGFEWLGEITGRYLSKVSLRRS